MELNAMLSLIFKIVLAVCAGGIIGLEREMKHKGAGLRTHIIICLGSMLAALTSLYLFDMYSYTNIVDPTRIIAGVVTGIGVLCAGTIMRGGETVIGLTTAATLWVISGIGVAIGAGFYVPAVLVTLTVYGVLYGMKTIQKKLEE
jgi:putative Mg2+ transporter-C (MgtC) family protein